MLRYRMEFVTTSLYTNRQTNEILKYLHDSVMWLLQQLQTCWFEQAVL